MPARQRDPKAFTRWFQLDYFRRPRPFRRLYGPVLTVVLLLTTTAAAVSIAFVVFRALGPRAAFQAAPVSTPHALIDDRCEVCHTGDRAFQTAWRLWPGAAHVSSVKDEACLQCHYAGRHNAHQTDFIQATDPGGPAQGCTRCHREHRGDAALARLPDAACTQCHADLPNHGGTGGYHPNITRFEVDHPAFGAWRKDQGGLREPGTVHFSHEAHLGLNAKFVALPADRPASPWLDANRKEAAVLAVQRCSYCHKPDPQGRYIRPVSYDDHCAACHPLLPQLNGDGWPDDMAAAFRRKPLHHPGAGETAAAVRGELLERFSALVFASPTQPPPPADEDVRPFILKRPIADLDEKQRQTVAQVGHAERSLFADDPKDFRPLPGFETLVDFDVKGGCAYCHEEDGRKDGLPQYKAPRLRDRGAAVKFPTDRFDSEVYQFDRNRWFPHARFDHAAHRMMTCIDCHAAEQSKTSEDVLMPAIDNCKQCHDAAAGKARSDCLECHGYHDHGRDRRIGADPPAVDALRNPVPR